MKNKEIAKHEFTGWFIPRKMIIHYVNKRITATQLLMVSTIDCLSKTQGFCFASNSYLAKSHGMTIRQVQQTLMQLEKKRYIVRSIHNKKRRIRARSI